MQHICRRQKVNASHRVARRIGIDIIAHLYLHAIEWCGPATTTCVRHLTSAEPAAAKRAVKHANNDPTFAPRRSITHLMIHGNPSWPATSPSPLVVKMDLSHPRDNGTVLKKESACPTDDTSQVHHCSLDESTLLHLPSPSSLAMASQTTHHSHEDRTSTAGANPPRAQTGKQVKK
ncbi:hypothetical protein BC567DRAFT_209976 [Phyllosticta citribraziliensis]